MQGKKPTREQRKVFNHYKLDPNEWLVQKNTLEELQIVNKNTKEIKTIKKGSY